MVRRAVLSLAFIAVACAASASASDYGTAPRAAPAGGLRLRVADRAPLCAPAERGCVETAIGDDVWPIANQDRIVVDWGSAEPIGPVVARTQHLYIAVEPVGDAATPARVTIDVVVAHDRVSLIVSQGGSRHTVSIERDTWVELPLADRTHPLYARLESG